MNILLTPSSSTFLWPDPCGPIPGYFSPQVMGINHGLLCVLRLFLAMSVHMWTSFTLMRLYWTHPSAHSACDKLCRIALQRSGTTDDVA